MSMDQMKECSNLPWCNTDVDKLGHVIMDFSRTQEAYMRRWTQKWFENMAFIFGRRDVKWSTRYDTAIQTDFLRRENSLNHKSQTNLARVVAEALASMIYANYPDFETDTPEESFTKGKRFRKICQKMLDYYKEQLNLDDEFKSGAMLFSVFGQVASKVDFNLAGGRIQETPRYRVEQVPIWTSTMSENGGLGLSEVPVQALNSEGQPLFERRSVPALDAKGAQIFDRKWSGDVRVDMLSPFEYVKEIGSPGMHKTKFIQHIRILDWDEYVQQYENMPGRNSNFTKIRPGRMTDIAWEYGIRQYLKLKFITPITSNEAVTRQDSGFNAEFMRTKVLVIEHYDKPHSKYWPNGRKLVIANGLCTHYTEPEYSTNKLDGWHPFCEAQWMSVPPSNNASGPLNDVIQKNRELDVADSLILTAMHRNMGSYLLTKLGGGLDPQRMSGTPGQIIEVDDPQTAARWLRDEQPINPVIHQLRSNFKDDVFENSGAGDALRGDRSKGASSGYQAKLYDEREERRLSPARKVFEKFLGRTGEKILACRKQSGRGIVDELLIASLKRQAAGEFTEQDCIAFFRTPISFGCDVNVKAGSTNYESKASEQATLLELIGKTPAGAILGQDSKVRDKFLKYFNADILRDDSATHREKAERENEVFADIGRFGFDGLGVSMPIVAFEDDDDIHETEHTQDLLTRFEEISANKVEFQLRLMHLEEHRMQRKEKQAQVPPGSTRQVPDLFNQAAQTAQTQPKPLPEIVATQQQQQAQAAQQAQGPQGAQATAQAGQPQGNAQPRPATIQGGGTTPNPAAPAAATQAGQRAQASMPGARK